MNIGDTVRNVHTNKTVTIEGIEKKQIAPSETIDIFILSDGTCWNSGLLYEHFRKVS